MHSCITDALKLLLPMNNAFCGISQGFSDLKQLRDVYQLTLQSSQIGNILNAGTMFYRFEDYYFYVLVSAAAQSTDTKLLYLKRLDLLMAYDRQQQSNNYESELSDGRFLKRIRFRFPVYFKGNEVQEISWDEDTTVETVMLFLREG